MYDYINNYIKSQFPETESALDILLRNVIATFVTLANSILGSDTFDPIVLVMMTVFLIVMKVATSKKKH